MFIEEKVRKEEQDYSKLKLSPQQKENVNAIAKLLAQELPISELALRGFIWKAIQKFQKKTNSYMEEGAGLSPEEKIKLTYAVANEVKQSLVKILRRSNDASIVDKAFDDAMNFYKEKLAYR